MATLSPFRILICCALGMRLASVCAAQEPMPTSLQMIVVTTPDWNTVPGRLQRYERKSAGQRWKPVGDSVAIVVGKNGMGWGAGVVPTNGPGIRDAADRVKKEGDGKSPAGAFTIGSGFGYAAQALPGLKLAYIPLTPTVECVDDTASHFYNQIVDRATVTQDWNSSEKMASEGVAYRWGAVINHNVNPAIPGVGSCVFLHVWSGPSSWTSGCTAMPQEQLEPILAWLDPAKSPLLVQLPVAQYKRLMKPWHLPKLPG
jgi:D-alanyl-D-alanine dipeptidase